MKIYFAGSVRGGRGDQEWYAQVVDVLKKFGVVLTEHLGDPGLDHFGERGITELEIYRRDMAWLSEADVLVAEITSPSIGVGYEIARAEDLRKPILCLYRSQPDRKVSIIVGDKYLRMVEYKDVDDIKTAIDEFMKTVMVGQA